MRAAEIWVEAWRNVSSGTARAVSLCVALTATIGLSAIAHTLFVTQLSTQAQQFQDAGASIYMLEADNNVDSAACDGLSGSDSVNASASLNATDGLTFTTLPSRTIPTWEATPGLIELFSFTHGPTAPNTSTDQNIWLSESIAEQLGIDIGATITVHPPASPDTTETLEVSGIYHYPDDGRDQLFAESAMLPVPPTHAASGLCLASFWPTSAEANPLLALTMISPKDSDGSPRQYQTLQLNSTLGTDFTWSTSLAPIFPIASAVAGLVIPLILLRIRQLEMASALHARVNKTSLGLILSAEWLIWILPTAIMTLTAVSIIAFGYNIDPPTPAILSGITTLSTGALTSYFATALLALTAKEAQLFRIFQSR